MIADRLKARLPKEKAFPVGISADDLQGIALTDDLKRDILAAINSNDVVDSRLGLFFAEHLIRPGVDSQFDHDLIEAALKHLKSGEWGIKEGCLSLLILLGQSMDTYRDVMLNALRDTEPMVRKKALTAYTSFSRPKEFEPLEAFETDDYVVEVGMGSHLVYDLRNQALERIEQVIGRTFPKSEKTAVHKDGAIVFWWNWEPFHEWKQKWWRKFIR